VSAPKQELPKPELSWDEALELAAADRDQLLERLHDHTRPQLYKAARKVSLLRWTWRLIDLRDDSVLACGSAFSGRAAWRRCHRAYDKELHR
jgi:hypothetical protein